MNIFHSSIFAIILLSERFHLNFQAFVAAASMND